MLNIKNIAITHDILKLIAELDEFKGSWTVLENFAPERLVSLRRIATIESIGSSTRIEGSKLSDVEVDRLLSKLETASFASRDEQEVAGYANAMDIVFDEYQTIALTENYIKQLHSELLKYSTKDQEHRGEYKKITNHVEAFGPDGTSLGVVFETATPFETPLWMRYLIDWYQRCEKDKAHHPLILIGIFVVVFLAIHPFRDGNGRLSRVLTTLLLLRAGYSYVPYSSMESIIELNKDSYYLALRRTQGTIRTAKQNWEHWLVFFLRMMVKQKDNLAAKIKKEQTLRATLPVLSRQIIELAKARGEVTIKDIELATGANRNTIKAHVRKLSEQQQLTSIGKGRGSRYTVFQ